MGELKTINLRSLIRLWADERLVRIRLFCDRLLPEFDSYHNAAEGDASGAHRRLSMRAYPNKHKSGSPELYTT